MPRTEEANQRIRDSQREKILENARRVFASKGWSATMADIAAAAESSQGLAYRYFPGKEAIFRELVERAVQNGLGVLQRIQDTPGTPGERLFALISWTFESRGSRADRADFYQFIMRGISDEATPADLRALLRQPGQAYQDLLRSLILAGQATGEIAQGDPDQLVIAVTACFDGLSRFSLRRSEYFQQHFPSAEIIYRLLKPC